MINTYLFVLLSFELGELGSFLCFFFHWKALRMQLPRDIRSFCVLTLAVGARPLADWACSCAEFDGVPGESAILRVNTKGRRGRERPWAGNL